ncbi:hypothetical protein CAEBREN_06222 [Caenorhabditis brenneri]|uniref:Sdz-33 F-box domain-containing protein n=1 Tax=Caenorhabditis brenneri TaxID=135651 RepID=G0N4J4_CAEBE|nr:hypothetical protein CAEBREN_06222 [Caenorhabditis brenneri]
MHHVSFTSHGMAFEPTTPIPLDTVMNLDNYSVEKKSLTDLILSSLHNCQLKNDLQSLKWQIDSFRLRILGSGSIDFYISFDRYTSIIVYLPHIRINQTPMIESYEFNQVEVVTNKSGKFFTDAREFVTLRLTIRMLLLHFMDILNVQKVELEVDRTKYTIDSLRKILQGIEVEMLLVDADLINNKTYLNSLIDAYPKAAKMSIESNINVNAVPDEVLLRYFDELSIRTRHTWSLDQLLFINSKFVFLTFQIPQEKVLNRFIKLWRGGSNPNLSILQIHVNKMNTKWDIETLMAGINYQEYNREQKQCVALDNRLIAFTERQQLLTIAAMNGKTATLQIRNSNLPYSIASFTIFIDNPTYIDKDGVRREYLELGGWKWKRPEKNYVWYDFRN